MDLYLTIKQVDDPVSGDAASRIELMLRRYSFASDGTQGGWVADVGCNEVIVDMAAAPRIPSREGNRTWGRVR